MEWFEIESDFELDNYFLPKLLNSTIGYAPNFELTGGNIRKSFGNTQWLEDSYMFDRLIRVDKLKPIEIAWGIDSYPEHGIVLKYYHPVPTILGGTNTPQISVKPRFSTSYNSLSRLYTHESSLSVTWPQFSKFRVKFLSEFYHQRYKNCLPGEAVDLIRLTDTSHDQQSMMQE